MKMNTDETFKKVKGLSVNKGGLYGLSGKWLCTCDLEKDSDRYLYSRLAVKWCDYFYGVKPQAEKSLKEMQEQEAYYLELIREKYANSEEIIEEVENRVTVALRRLYKVANEAGFEYRHDARKIRRSGTVEVTEQLWKTNTQVRFRLETGEVTPIYKLDSWVREKLEKEKLGYNLQSMTIIVKISEKLNKKKNKRNERNMNLQTYIGNDGNIFGWKKVRVRGSDLYDLRKENLIYVTDSREAKKESTLQGYEVPEEAATLNRYVEELLKKEGKEEQPRGVIEDLRTRKYYAYIRRATGLVAVGGYVTRHEASYGLQCAYPKHLCVDEYKLSSARRKAIKNEVEKYLALNDTEFENTYSSYEKQGYHILTIKSKYNNRKVEVKVDYLLAAAASGSESIKYLQKKKWELNNEGEVVDANTGMKLEDYVFCNYSENRLFKRKPTLEESYDYRKEGWLMKSSEMVNGKTINTSKYVEKSGTYLPKVRLGIHWLGFKGLNYAGHHGKEQAVYAHLCIKEKLNIPANLNDNVAKRRVLEVLTRGEKEKVEKQVTEQIVVVKEACKREVKEAYAA